MKLSIVSPVYKAEFLIDELIKRLIINLEKITPDFEIILVDDASPDNSWDKILEHCIIDKRIKGLKLSRNFGQHYAIAAGLDIVSGDWIVVMDCDLQDRPEEILNLLNKGLEGFDVVLASRNSRKDTFFKRIFSTLFYKILSYLTGITHDATVANFGIYNRKVIDTICSLKENIRYFPTLIGWVGFKQTKIEVEHANRFQGKTSYNFTKLMKLSIDVILVNSEKPIRLIIKLGFTISLFSFGFAIYTLIEHLSGNIKVIGYASLIVSIWFLSGVILMTLGILGLYIGKTFEGVKNRPIYIVSDKVN